MAWAPLAPFLVPLPPNKDALKIAPIPHTLLVAVLFASSLQICHSPTLIPLAIIDRSLACLSAHGPLAILQVRHVTVDTAKLDQFHSVNVFIATAAHYVLVYHVLISTSQSLYEVHDKNDPDRTLQNALPLALQSKFSFGSLLRSATRSILAGGSASVNLENVEHFNNLLHDDEVRNGQIPSVKASRVKLLKMNAAICGFWCKLNSQNLIFYNDVDELHVLNLKSFNSDIVSIHELPWFNGTLLLAYDVARNWFFHLDSHLHLLLLRFAQETGGGGNIAENGHDTGNAKLTLHSSPLLSLEEPLVSVHFNPQKDVVLFCFESSIQVYSMTQVGKLVLLAWVSTVASGIDVGVLTCSWAPDGSFFVVANSSTGDWSVYSTFGSVLFDSATVKSSLLSSRAENSNEPAVASQLAYLSAFHVAVASNSRNLYIIDKNRSNIYLQPLTSLSVSDGQAVLQDADYLSIPLPDHSLARFSYPPQYQRTIASMQSINGVPDKQSFKRHTGKLTVALNEWNQFSISYGNQLSVSTPAACEKEAFHVLWFNFTNHFLEPMNIVSHFWAGDILFLMNRFFRTDTSEDPELVDTTADELILVDAARTRYGLGGTPLKFDTDLILWRHTFKKRVLTHEVQPTGDGSGSHILTLITSDLKNIVLEVARAAKAPSTPQGILVRIRRTIHLSSMKHKLAIALVKRVVMFQEKHFFFLLDNGDVFLLKNQAPVEAAEPGRRRSLQLSNMYELEKIHGAVEWLQKSAIRNGDMDSVVYISLFSKGSVYCYDARGLVDVEGTAREPIVLTVPFYPLRIQQSGGSIEVVGIDYHTAAKNDHLVIKQKLSRQMVLNRFIQHDLLQNKLPHSEILRRYSGMGNFDYCLELLLFDFLDVHHDDESLGAVIALVNSTENAHAIYVNFLRKIEMKYWGKFFHLLGATPLGLMRSLIDSQNTQLCYNYLIVYLNFKKESEGADTNEESHDILQEKDEVIILQIITLLKKAHKWDECFELCRFLKLLDPSGNLLKTIRSELN